MSQANAASDLERAEHQDGAKKILAFGFDEDGERHVQLAVNPDGTLKGLVGMEIPPHDYIAATYPQGDTEVYTYKSGGASGTVVATITVVYTDATKEVLSSVTKA